MASLHGNLLSLSFMTIVMDLPNLSIVFLIIIGIQKEKISNNSNINS